jgi:hypothetical protein
MERIYYQEEESYLFSSLLGELRDLSQKNVPLTTRCVLAIFWRLYGERQYLDPLLEAIENEIDGLDADPTRESNRKRKVFACAAYKVVVGKGRHEEKIKNYLAYAKDSGNWLGQPRIACCLTFLKGTPIGEEAKNYLRENFGPWLSDGRNDFIAIALLGLRNEISDGDLQRTLEHVEPRINDLPLNVTSLFLIGISQSDASLLGKDAVEDKLYQAIRDQIKEISSFTDEEIISAATALFLAKYHRISGYFAKYFSELKETLALKDSFAMGTRKAETRNLLLCIASIATIGLLCLMFFIPSLVEFKGSPSAFGKFLLTISTQKKGALGTAIVLTAYILISYFKKGDPVSGIVEYVRERVPVMKEDQDQGGRFHSHKRG